MVETIPTAFLFFAAALVLPLLPRGPVRGALLLALPAAALAQIWFLPAGSLLQAGFFGFELELMRVDALSRPFALVFALAALIGNLYAWHLRDTVEQAATLVYAGAAIGAVFAGDLITLFFYWEGTAIASVFLIWARRSPGAYFTGMRYLLVQVGSGVILLAGIALFWHRGDSLDFTRMALDGPAGWAILLAFGIKAAFPLLHNWLQDGYPAATVTGTVILSAFTTKMAVYALARGFAGAEILIYIGAVMAVFPAFHAQVENDLRRVLSYALNSQIGFMVVGVGIGTEMALNGTVGHALASVLYKALLFMAMGAVLYRTGTARASDLGGLYRTMPLTALLCLVGAASIAAVPLFSGFVVKSLVLGQIAESGRWLVWGGLIFASAAAVSHTAIRIPHAAFFARDSGRRPAEAPAHMLLAMGLAAALSLGIGLFPGAFYGLLPHPLEYQPYKAASIVGQLQLVLFVLLGFAFLARSGLLAATRPGIVLDSDWSYRRLAPALLRRIAGLVARAWALGAGLVARAQGTAADWIRHSEGPEGRLAHVWPTGSMVQWLAIILGVMLIVVYLG